MNKGMRGSEKKNKIKRKKKIRSYGEDRTGPPEIIKKMGGGMIYKDMGGLVGGQTKLDMNKDGMITGQDFKMMTKKHGGKITYRMNGGQVVAGSYE